MSAFLNDELSKKTSIFGLHLWVVVGIIVGAAIVLLLFLISLWYTSKRNSTNPQIPPNIISTEIKEIRVDPSRTLPEKPDPLPEPEKEPLNNSGAGGYQQRIQIEIGSGNGKGHLVKFPDRVGSGGGSGQGSGEERSGEQGSIAVPEVSHLGWGHWYTLRELEIATNFFAHENVIGEGGYGIVYRGVMDDNSSVAVKNLLNNRGQAEREFKVEVEAIGRVRHKNLVRLLGYCAEGAHRMLVYEYVDNGNLEQWLHGDVGPYSPLTWEIRMNIILGAAKGLTYLHEGLEPKVVHRDIKSSNILLDKQWNSKVSDFGLAKLLGSERSYITTRVMGTFGYVAPEYASTGMLNDRSDVYSFGILVMEIISGRNPVDYSRAPGEVNLVEWLKTMVSNRNSEGVLDPKLREKPSSRALKRALLVALRCVDPNAQKRPKMGHVIHMLEADDFPFRDDRRTGREHGRLHHDGMKESVMDKRIIESVRQYQVPLQRYMAMMDLQERNERLFYKLLIDHVEELLPIVYTPTVGEACQKYGSIFRRPQGLFISLKEKGKILEVLKNWPEKSIQVIVVTDGERILGLGDLGCQGMGIPVGKLSLYTALGGVRPSVCLPITIDVGTNNQQLLDNEFYIGLKQKRATGQEYAELLDEFMSAVKQNYGEKVLIQFEDFANHNAFDLLAKYRTTHLVFNDDIQGTASVVLAGLIASLKLLGGTLADHTFLFLGAGEAGTGIAELIALEITKRTSVPLEEARKKIWLVDSKGLVVSSRLESLQHFKKPWAHDHEPVKELIDAVKAIKPTVLIGTSGVGKTFTKEVVETMASLNPKPLIMALSNPTSQAECTAEEAYTWSKGHAIFASGSPFDPFEYEGRTFVSGQANNAYIFPGFGLGIIMSGTIRVHDDMLLAASEALAAQVTEEDYLKGRIYPPFTNIRKISAHIAAEVAAKAYELGLATRLPRPTNLEKYAESCMYTPVYRTYR